MTVALLLTLMTLAPQSDLLTVAESSDFTRTASHAQVMNLLDRIEARSSIMRRGELGTTVEGKSIPLVIFADPPGGERRPGAGLGQADLFRVWKYSRGRSVRQGSPAYACPRVGHHPRPSPA